METHVKVVGVLNIVFAALGLCLAAVLGLIFAGSAAAVAADADADARIALPILGLTGSALVGFLVVWSLPCLIEAASGPCTTYESVLPPPPKLSAAATSMLPPVGVSAARS